MAKYIEIGEVMKAARNGYHSDFGRSMADLTSLREVLEDTPNADVESVVRCRDCKHYVANYCTRDIKGRTNMFYMSDNDFCSYGKTKDGDKE